MKYITHRRFKDLAICGQVNLPYGTELEELNNFIMYNGQPICIDTSENANLHFAINEDGNGLERGKLTYAIAYKPRKSDNGYRFSDEEAEMLTNEYPHFIKGKDFILFNTKFFHADIEDLRKLTEKLNISVE